MDVGNNSSYFKYMLDSYRINNTETLLENVLQ